MFGELKICFRKEVCHPEDGSITTIKCFLTDSVRNSIIMTINSSGLFWSYAGKDTDAMYLIFILYGTEKAFTNFTDRVLAIADTTPNIGIEAIFTYAAERSARTYFDCKDVGYTLCDGTNITAISGDPTTIPHTTQGYSMSTFIFERTLPIKPIVLIEGTTLLRLEEIEMPVTSKNMINFGDMRLSNDATYLSASVAKMISYEQDGKRYVMRKPRNDATLTRHQKYTLDTDPISILVCGGRIVSADGLIFQDFDLSECVDIVLKHIWIDTKAKLAYPEFEVLEK